MTDTQFYFLCLILVLSTLLYRSSSKKPKKQEVLLCLPPSPPALPLIGHLHLLSLSLYKSLHKLSIKYGPLLCLQLGSSRCIVVASASMATEVFKTNDLSFADRPSFAFEDELPYQGEGFFSAQYSDYWRFMKKLCMTQLLGAKQVEKSRSIRREEIAQLLHKALKCAQKREVIDVGAELMKLSNNAICRLAMSTRSSGETNEAESIRKLVKESLQVAAKICLGDVLGPLKRVGFWLYGKQAVDVTMKYDAIMERIWKEHEEDGSKRENEDLMDILLKVYKDDKAEYKMTRTQVKALLLDIFVAGTGSSGEVMQWTMSELINNPNIFKKLREEIDSVVGNTRLVDESDVSSLPYLQAVVKETLRLYPPLAVVVRQCRESCKIKGYDIPEKAMVALNLYSIMRDPKVWDNPNEFQPERFFASSKVQDVQNGNEIRERNLVDFVAFGGGRRLCPGTTLAYHTIHSTIAAMVQCFDWKVGEGGQETKVDMEVGSGLSMAKANSLVCLPVVHFSPLLFSN